MVFDVRIGNERFGLELASIAWCPRCGRALAYVKEKKVYYCRLCKKFFEIREVAKDGEA